MNADQALELVQEGRITMATYLFLTRRKHANIGMIYLRPHVEDLLTLAYQVDMMRWIERMRVEHEPPHHDGPDVA